MWPLNFLFDFYGIQLVMWQWLPWTPGENPNSKYLQLCSDFTSGHNFHTQEVSFQLCHTIHFCWGLHRPFLSMCPALGILWYFRFPGLYGSFPTLLFLEICHSLPFPPRLLDLSIVCLNYKLLPQEAMTNSIVIPWMFNLERFLQIFHTFSQTPALTQFCSRYPPFQF